jgi:hypothetical protein
MIRLIALPPKALWGEGFRDTRINYIVINSSIVLGETILLNSTKWSLRELSTHRRI